MKTSGRYTSLIATTLKRNKKGIGMHNVVNVDEPAAMPQENKTQEAFVKPHPLLNCL